MKTTIKRIARLFSFQAQLEHGDNLNHAKKVKNWFGDGSLEI